ncbi:MAG: hypothetical protein M3290_04160 [Actinomycetota bacterium]|nr:hypothetical protein [Actinomycetota bacterium]
MAVPNSPPALASEQRRLPKVLTSSVIRAADKGNSHGGLYLVDLETGAAEMVRDWDDPSISWEGRGGDRGLRGIAFYGDEIIVAASDELFFFDKTFEIQSSLRNQYLRSTHEVFRTGDHLWVTSTEYDSILRVDLRERRFDAGVHLTAKRIAGRTLAFGARWFDPTTDGGPPRRDVLHINSVWGDELRLTVCGTQIRNILEVHKRHARRHLPVPLGTHNARPFGNGAIANDTRGTRVVTTDRAGHESTLYPIKTYPASELIHDPGDPKRARQGFGRGLCLHGSLVVTGSSPATVTAFDLGCSEMVRTVNISMDVRNAIHGLEVWPY